jgi:hypothetical protein
MAKPWPVGRQIRDEKVDVDRWRRDGGQQRRPVARHLGRVLLLLAVAALALVASQWLGDGSRASCVRGVEQCLDGRSQGLLLVIAAVVAAHIVIFAAIVVTAWLASQPPPRHGRELVLRRRAWSGLAVAVVLVAVFFWSVAASGA